MYRWAVNTLTTNEIKFLRQKLNKSPLSALPQSFFVNMCRIRDMQAVSPVNMFNWAYDIDSEKHNLVTEGKFTLMLGELCDNYEDIYLDPSLLIQVDTQSKIRMTILNGLKDTPSVHTLSSKYFIFTGVYKVLESKLVDGFDYVVIKNEDTGSEHLCVASSLDKKLIEGNIYRLTGTPASQVFLGKSGAQLVVCEASDVLDIREEVPQLLSKFLFKPILDALLEG